jgi:signal transduction histidine kinase
MKLLLQNSEDQCTSSALSQELFKIEQYVEMVLHYLRLESMSSDFLIRQYELRDIVSQAVKKHAVLFINKKLSFNLEEFSCKVVTDEKWLMFVIEQIISNALKYTPSGSISIYTQRVPDKLILVIEDTGIGIRPEDLPRIFERGFTGYNGRLDKKSTGIGLYLCKQILDKLSHTIEVSSGVGKGTRISIGFTEE